MYRGRRLNDRLESIDLIDLNDVINIQNDNFSYKAYETLPIILNKVDTLSLNRIEKQYFKNVSRWDYFANPYDTITPIFNLWWNKIRSKLWDEFDTMKYSYRKPNSFTTKQIIEKFEDFDFYDNLKTPNKESIDDIIFQSFKETLDSINNWKNYKNKSRVYWKDFKNTRVKHLLNIKSFSLDNIEIGGNSNIINAASQGHGPSWRMTVSYTHLRAHET